jgi:hypothetical protein
VKGAGDRKKLEAEKKKEEGGGREEGEESAEATAREAIVGTKVQNRSTSQGGY